MKNFTAKLVLIIQGEKGDISLEELIQNYNISISPKNPVSNSMWPYGGDYPLNNSKIKNVEVESIGD